MRKGWLNLLPNDVYYRLCQCETLRDDLTALVSSKWQHYKQTGKAENGYTKEDALVSVLELLDCNGIYYDLTMDEYNALKA